MAEKEEEKNEVVEEEYTGPFKEMDFDEPNEEDLYGIPKEDEPSAKNEDSEEETEEDEPQLYDPDRVDEEDASEPTEHVDVPEGMRSELVDVAKKKGLNE